MGPQGEEVVEATSLAARLGSAIVDIEVRYTCAGGVLSLPVVLMHSLTNTLQHAYIAELRRVCPSHCDPFSCCFSCVLGEKIANATRSFRLLKMSASVYDDQRNASAPRSRSTRSTARCATNVERYTCCAAPGGYDFPWSKADPPGAPLSPPQCPQDMNPEAVLLLVVACPALV